MNKIILLIVIVILIAIGGYFFMTNRTGNIKTSVSSVQIDTLKYDEYFRSIYLGKIANGQEVGYGAVPEITGVFTKGKDQYCTIVEVKKEIPQGTYASAIYDVNSKTYFKQKTAFQGVFDLGTNAGCGSIPVPAGKYEYRSYLDDVLIFVFPFEVRDSS